MRKIIILLILVCTIFIGCQEKVINEKHLIDLPKCKTENSLILYNRFRQSLLSYNTKTFKTEEESNIENYVQYDFKTKSDYYTTGNSTTNGFEIIRIYKNDIMHVLKLRDEKNQAIFPLATDETKTIFLKEIYSTDGVKEKTNIVELDKNNNLIEFSGTKGFVMNGEILNGKLYYTTYFSQEDINKVDGTFSLYALDVSNYLSESKLIETGLKSYNIYQSEGKIYKSDGERIYYSNTDSYKKASGNYFDDKTHTLIQIYVNKDASLEMDVIDTKTRKVIGTSLDIIDYVIENNEVIAYCDGHIDNIKLN